MKPIKIFINIEPTQTLAEFQEVAGIKVNLLQYDNQSYSCKLYNFLVSENTVVTTMDDQSIQDLNYTSNIVNTENMSNYPLGFKFTSLVKMYDIIVSPASPLASLQDVLDLATAIADKKLNDSNLEIPVMRVIDRKFGGVSVKYVLPTVFGSSIYANQLDFVSVGNYDNGSELYNALWSTTSTVNGNTLGDGLVI